MQINPFFTKAAALLAVTGLLAIALDHIGGLARERQQRLDEAEQSVAQSQAGPQTVLGPALLSECVEEWTAKQIEGRDSVTTVNKREFRLMAMPRQLDVKATATMEPRYRGLFKVNTFVAKAHVQALWAPSAALRPVAEHANSRLSCKPPVLMLSVSDARGIRLARVKVDGNALPVVAGTGHATYARGIHVALPETVRSLDAPLSAEVELELVGTANLALAPVADDNRFELSANWPHPSFGGRFLPTTRTVRGDGFSATWQVSGLATTAPLDFARDLAPSAGARAEANYVESFDVSFIDPINPYSLSDRAIKYGLLFVGLTFVVVAMVEVMRRLRVHPIQYLLVGCALSIFFLLLLSLSEHLAFGLSYALAAGACAALLAAYGSFVLGGWRPGLAFGAGIAALYGALYLLLQMEQTAMVMGSVLLFVVLAGVMLLTRRVDWYGLLRSPRPGAA